MNEREVRGYVDSTDFDRIVSGNKSRFGEFKYSRRLSFAIADNDSLDLETKIRVTDGEVDITQKLGDFNSIDREEFTVELGKLEPTLIVDLFITYRNLSRDIKNRFMVLIQHENYIFRSENYELKLFRQFGKDEFHAFELEALQDLEVNELYDICKSLGLVIDHGFNNRQSVIERNDRVNINLDMKVKLELVECVEKFLMLDN